MLCLSCSKLCFIVTVFPPQFIAHTISGIDVASHSESKWTGIGLVCSSYSKLQKYFNIAMACITSSGLIKSGIWWRPDFLHWRLLQIGPFCLGSARVLLLSEIETVQHPQTGIDHVLWQGWCGESRRACLYTRKPNIFRISDCFEQNKTYGCFSAKTTDCATAHLRQWVGLSALHGGLSDSCVNCSTINNFKSKIKVELEPEL